MNINNERFDIFNLFNNLALITYPNTALFKVKVKQLVFLGKCFYIFIK